MEEKILHGSIETGEENIVKVIYSESNDLINTINGGNVYAELHNCWDTIKDYVDIDIDTTFDKEALGFIIEVLQDFYNQMN